jgi:hypothetical protein
MKKGVILILILFSISTKFYGQLAVTGFTIYAVGINTDKTKKISYEMKIFTNNYIDDLPLELNAFYNFKTREYHRFSIGLGFNLSPFRGFDEANAVVIPTSLEIFPMKDFKKIAIVLELTPIIGIGDDVALRSLVGIRYSFDKKR